MLGVSEQDYADVLDLICEAALEPDAWGDVLRRLADLTGCIAGGLTIEDSATLQGKPLVYFGFDASHVERTFAYYLPQNPLFAIKDQMRPGFVVTNGMVVPHREFRRSGFYDGWARPQGICCPVTVVLHRDGPIYAPLTLVRPDGKGDASEEHCALLGRLAPHLSRALRTGMLLERAGRTTDALGESLAGLAAAVFLLDGKGRVIYANPAAETIVSAMEALFIGRGRMLAAADRASNISLQAAISKVLVSDGISEGADVGVARSGLRPLSVTVQPVKGRQTVILPGDQTPACMVLIRDPEELALDGAAEKTARLYGLTPAEARLLAVLLSGEGLNRAAEALGVSRTTAQSHLKQVFAKTNTNRQGELIRVVFSSTVSAKH